MIWALIWNGLTAISTLVMAIIAGFALGTWKSEQKRTKLVKLLEILNKYIQDLQYYELESTIFARQTRNNNQEDFYNNEIIAHQDKLIDLELADGLRDCILAFKNWEIEYIEQYNILNNIYKKLEKYRLETFIYIEKKIKFYIERNKPENILYANNNATIEQIKIKKEELKSHREELMNSIKELKDKNRNLLK